MKEKKKKINPIRRLWNFLRDENLDKLLIIIGILIVVSAVGISWFEKDISLINGIWWSIVTLTTVGYGDISPVTNGGRIIAVMIMFFGIGLLGMLSGTLASILINNRLKENKGMRSFDFEGHIIISEWNHRVHAIIKEFRADSQVEETKIILIADIEEKPVDDSNLYFIKGNVTEETLERANISKAKTIIVLGDDRIDENARDAKVILSTLTIEHMHSDVYTVVELVDEANVRHCERANADEIIVGSELSSHLIASAAINHGLSRIVSELLSTQYGNDLYSMPLPEKMQGLPFLDVFTRMKKEKQCTVLGVQKGRAGKLITNPPGDYNFSDDDYLLVIAPGNATLIG